MAPSVEESALPYAVPRGTRVYAVGDVHGRDDLLGAILDEIRADSEGCAAARKVVVYLGDYIDRGPASREVVERLIGDPLPGFEAVHLKGNHEDFLLTFLDDPGVGPVWTMNGGGATLRSYGVAGAGGILSVPDYASLRDRLRARLEGAHLAFYQALGTTHREGGYLFVHAGVRPGVPIDAQSAHDLIWIREEFLYARTDFGCRVVHGHTPAPEPEILPNRIGIDTGAFMTGRLTALVLEGTQARPLST